MGNLLSVDGAFIRILTKLGNLILLNVLWIIGCIPLITIGTSTTAFYYATVKTVRRERSYPAKEFWQSYRKNLLRGSLVTLVFLALALLLYLNREYAATITKGTSITKIILYDGILLVAAAQVVCIFPVLSRFSLGLVQIWKLTFVMSIRFLPYTILLMIGTLTALYLQFRYLPIPMIFMIPALWCYTASYLMERMLKKFTPKPLEGEDAWYYE
ncbi:MAG: YesL family protein [Clostridiales bacterium]|nr:YesL family protein [Clostridiales bacterium]